MEFVTVFTRVASLVITVVSSCWYVVNNSVTKRINSEESIWVYNRHIKNGKGRDLQQQKPIVV